ncbi:MAG: PspC domain-containing protein, partial [Candidatus Dormiibacterota bacterium]
MTSRPLTDSLAREGPPADGRASGAPGPAEPSMLSHRFARSESDRVVLGVAGGLGRHFGVDPLLIRLGFAVLVAAGGLGIVLYVVAWGASVAPSPTPPDHSVRWLPRNRQIAATGCIVVGLLLIARDLGLWFGDPVVWPLALAAGGSAVI